MIYYSDNIDGIKKEMLEGFFNGWIAPLSSDQHFKTLQNSDYFILAIDSNKNKVVGFITAITDHVNSAFIPLLEVLQEYKNKGIGSNLVQKILEKLKNVSNIDLTCDLPIQKFYKKFGMIPSTGMVLRKYIN